MTALFAHSGWVGTQYLVETREGFFYVPMVPGGWQQRRPRPHMPSLFQPVVSRHTRELLEWLGVPLEEEHAQAQP